MISIDLRNTAAAEIWRRHTIGALYELAKRAPGKNATLKVGSDDILLLQDARGVKQVLRDNASNYDKHFGTLEGFFGDSRLTSNGERWEMLQRLSQPYLTGARPERVAAASTEAFRVASAAILAESGPADGVSIDPHLNHAAARVVNEVALGFQTLVIDEALMSDFRDVLRYGSLRLWIEAGGPQPEDPQMRQCYFAARERLAASIMAAADRATDEGAQPGLLQELVKGQEHGVDLVGEVCTLLFAGFDTSAAAVGWGLFLLAAMPDLQSMLRTKVSDACGGAPPTLQQLNAIPELAAFQNEVLRIFPPIPVLGRIAKAPDRIGDTSIRENQRILLSIIGLHHDRTHFPSPAALRLDRYPNGETTKDQMGHLLPFGAGRRVCGGSRIANVELAAAFAVLLQTLQVSLPEQPDLRFEWNASLRRLGGHRFLVRPV